MKQVIRKAFKPIPEIERLLANIKPDDGKTPHPLRAFFVVRRIEWEKIAAVVGVTKQCVAQWMTGTFHMPKKKEIILNAIRDEVLQWERENGKLFNSNHTK